MSLVKISLISGTLLIEHSLRFALRRRASEFAIPSLIQIRRILKRGSLGSVNNIVNLDKFKKQKQYESTEDPTLVFVRDTLIPWAQANNLDTSSRNFKMGAAAIMTILQGMYGI